MTALCVEHGVKLLAFGTLAGGLLTERWLGRPAPDVAELDTWSEMKHRRFVDSAGGWDALQHLLETVAEYGFKRGDLDSVQDHRLTKLLYDFSVMRERFAAANAGAKKVVTVGKQRRARSNQQAPKTALKTQLAQARESNSTEEKTKAVAALLGQIK